MRQLAKFITLQLLRGYKCVISPMFAPACRYVPSCSEYAMEAVERYGAVRGGMMALWRLVRCHPFARGGYDPVNNQDVHFSQEMRETGNPELALPQGLKPNYFSDASGTAEAVPFPREPLAAMAEAVPFPREPRAAMAEAVPFPRDPRAAMTEGVPFEREPREAMAESRALPQTIAGDRWRSSAVDVSRCG